MEHSEITLKNEKGDKKFLENRYMVDIQKQ